MFKTPNFFVYLAVMAVVTYLIRLLPLLFVRKKFNNRFIRSFLYYVPYAVLAAMTFPTLIISATNSIATGIVVAVVCIVVAYFNSSLILVASAGAVSALVSEVIIQYVIPLL